MTNRYAVFGCPAHHSLSPWLHTRFSEQTQRNLSYGLYQPCEAHFASQLRAFFAADGIGANITVPYKTHAVLLADQTTDFVRRSGVANVLHQKNNQLIAFNTDGAGFIRDIKNHLPSAFENLSFLIIGAGGAAKAVALAIRNQNPLKLEIINRTVSRAHELAKLTNATVLEEYPKESPDIIINTISAGHTQNNPIYPPKMFRNAKLVYDLSYGIAAQSFLEQALSAGAKYVMDGTGMLAWQAALSFSIWEGVLPSVDALIHEMRPQQPWFA